MDDRVFQLHAEVCKTLANPWRLKLIELLRHGERPLKELVEATGIPLANVSQHLNLMKTAGVVQARREGSRSFYRLANPKMLKAFDLIREILFEQMQREGTLVQHFDRAHARP